MKRTLAIFAMVLISGIAGSSGALADENVFQEIGEDFSNLGKEIGKTGKEVGKQLGKTGKQVGKDVSKGAKDVGKAFSGRRVVLVPGNHDHFFGSDLGFWTDHLEGMGVRVLNNSGTRLIHGGDGIWVAGVDDLAEGKPDLRAALDGARDDEPVILLAHNPDFFFEAAAVRIDLIRTRYALASVMDVERALIEEQRNLIVRRRQLRDPVELAVQARARGFRPISVVLSLPDPIVASPDDTPRTMALPSLASALPTSQTGSDWR